MRKFFAIFVAITLWNASALGANDSFVDTDDGLTFEPGEKLCSKDAPYNTKQACENAKGDNQVCCAKIVTTNSTTTYNCDTGYTKTLIRYCTKTTETTDATGYKKTVETCDANELTILGTSTTCYYLQDSANGFTNCLQVAEKVQ